MSCGVGCRRGSDLALLWLWHRSTTAALIGPLVLELPYAASAVLKKKKKNSSFFNPNQMPKLSKEMSFVAKLKKSMYYIL